MMHTKKIFWLWIVLSLAITGGLTFARPSDSGIDTIGGTINNWIDQWLNVSLPCNPASVSNGSVNSTTCAITCNAWYDKSWNSCILHQSSWWGGGWGWSTISTCTLSKLMCTDWKYILKSWVSCEWWQLGYSCNIPTWWSTSWSNWSNLNNNNILYSDEFNNAYQFAFRNGITTMPTIQETEMTWLLIRSHMAKMMVNYAINVLNRVLDTSKSCEFADMDGQSQEMKDYAIKSCQLWIMGINTVNFMPNDIVTRAQFATVLSRVLRWSKYNNNWEEYYRDHLRALQESNIISVIDPSLVELRWYIMLMLMRSQSN